MSEPPSSLPSPLSSATSHLPFAMSVGPHTAPARAPSEVSHMSSTSAGREIRSPTLSSSSGLPDDPSTPQPPSTQHYPPNHPHHYPSSVYIPPVTSSPPPQPPTYVPPPQHALPPDPIHSHPPFAPTHLHAQIPPGQNMMWPAGPSGPGPAPWRPNAPGGPMYPAYRGMPNGAAGYDGFPQTRNPLSMGHVHGMGLNGVGRPTSAGDVHDGGPRERRRDRSHHRVDDDERTEDEVISTIFVVGFPDDMNEREFQNIFTFAPGFEAATLKFPSGSGRTREPTAAFLHELAQVAAAQQAGDPNNSMLDFPLQSPALEEALAALQLSNSTSSATTPSAAVSLTPSALSASAFGGLPSLPSRRQTIGFARFRTRQDAINAKEQLQGKKIDPLTGGTLKAEMAKKNLHTKRNAGSNNTAMGQDELMGVLLRAGQMPGLAGQTSQIIPPGAYPGKDAWDVQFPSADKDVSYLQQPYPSAAPAGPSHHPSATSDSSRDVLTSPNTRQSDSKALLALAEEADELEGWNAVSMGMTMEGLPTRRREGSGGTNPAAGSQLTSPHSTTNPLSPTLGPNRVQRDSNSSSASSGAGVSTNGHGAGLYRPLTNNGYGTQGGHGEYLANPTFDGDRVGLGGGPNPADQNPPINTLYVGNLPAISPPTHPPNFLEESLRALFSRCAGYKRMSFRQKINGPMCFVEFDDVPFAAQAIKDLYGNNLSGLVKGGIRLSYSKNSLGQRGNAHPSGPNSSLFGGIAHTVALAGMSSPTTATAPNSSQPNGQPNPGYGLQLHTQQTAQTAQSAPIPMPGDLRRGSESVSTGLSSGLSPTAQPFNASLPLPTSPRSRYFGASGTSPGTAAGGVTASSYSTTHSASSSNPSSASQSGALPIASPPAPQNNGQFSPVASPIRTPASFSWVSSGSVAGAVGNGGYAFDPFSVASPTAGGLSLNGAASAWGQGGAGK